MDARFERSGRNQRHSQTGVPLIISHLSLESSTLEQSKFILALLIITSGSTKSAVGISFYKSNYRKTVL